MGYAFRKLRPYGDAVGSTGGIASGPITFMRTFDQMCETIAQGGARRGAQMGVMCVFHPDVIQFIHAKNKDVSLAQTLKLNDPDDFMEALEAGEEFTFTNPRTGEPHVATPETKELYDMFDLGEYVEVGETLSVPAAELWDHLVAGAHENGEPGVIYLERVNKLPASTRRNTPTTAS